MSLLAHFEGLRALEFSEFDEKICQFGIKFRVSLRNVYPSFKVKLSVSLPKSLPI